MSFPPPPPAAVPPPPPMAEPKRHLGGAMVLASVAVGGWVIANVLLVAFELLLRFVDFSNTSDPNFDAEHQVVDFATIVLLIAAVGVYLYPRYVAYRGAQATPPAPPTDF